MPVRNACRGFEPDVAVDVRSPTTGFAAGAWGRLEEPGASGVEEVPEADGRR